MCVCVCVCVSMILKGLDRNLHLVFDPYHHLLELQLQPPPFLFLHTLLHTHMHTRTHTHTHTQAAVTAQNSGIAFLAES